MVQAGADVLGDPRRLDLVAVEFNEPRLISDAGLLLTATLACQWPFVSPHRRPSFLPTDGHVFSPVVATNLPTHTG
jgi:hypothetical protein